MDFVRRAVELPEDTLPVYRAERTAKHHRGLRKQAGTTYDQAKARGPVEQSIRRLGWSCPTGPRPSIKWPRRSAPG
ncbi:hypothetical protein YW7DRAFT_00852 [Streptomyces sp. AmelKG-E11A]|nr:hypothetical protein YW7DRAFT_00852 [Streptomyces sp. AmelKG-E11A]